VFSEQVPFPVLSDWTSDGGKRARAGLPTDYSYQAFYKPYRKIFETASAKHGVPYEVILEKLKKLRVIERFSPSDRCPNGLTWQEAYNFLGMTESEWRAYLNRTAKTSKIWKASKRSEAWWKIEPLVVRGDVFDLDVIYWGPSILTIANFLDSQGIGTTVRPRNPQMRLAFSKHLTKVVSTLLARMQIAPPVTVLQVTEKTNVIPIRPIAKPSEPATHDTWPKGLPRDWNGVVTQYAPYVYDQIRRCSVIKTPDELEELNQAIWTKLISANALDRFVERATSKLPSTISLVDTLGYLGITAEQFDKAVKRAVKNDWLIRPVSGKETDAEVYYMTADIETLDTSGFLPEDRLERRRPEPSCRGFKSYLAQAVQNHFKNLIRTKKRRHQERPADSRSVFKRESGGLFSKVAVMEEGASWEDTLADQEGASMEDMLDFLGILRKHQIDPRTPKGTAILDLITKGYTLKEAQRSYERSLSRSELTGPTAATA